VALGTVLVLCGLVVASGCAKYNTFYNAKKWFDQAERAREEAIEQGSDVETASRGQRQNYMRAIDKAKKILREHPGHDLTDDALFLLGKSYQRLASYRESIRRLDQLFINFPATEFLEEAVFLQAVNYLMLGNAARSQEFLDRLATQFPESRFQSEALRASGDNAYALEDWEDAAADYGRFLAEFPEAENWDQSAMRRAQSLWELDRFADALVVLDDIEARSEQADLVFRARLLEARCRARVGDQGLADELIGQLRNEAAIHSMEGNVTLAEAENLIAAGDLEGGMVLLQDMPQEHYQDREVKSVRADLLGYGYLEQGELEKARESFQEAVGGGDLLDDVDGTRLLLDTIKDYLAAEGQLPDADPPRAASLRLIKANALLFGFERPHEALQLYAEVAADSAADSTTAPRALYGAMVVHEKWLGHPDSAAIYREQLQTRFPDSPHAYEAFAGSASDLLDFLLEREEEQYAAMRADSNLVGEATQGMAAAEGAGRGTGLRRRLVYLQRRDNIEYPPPPVALAALQERRAAAAAAREAARAAAADSAAAVALADTADADGGVQAYDLLPEHLRPETPVTEPSAAVTDTAATPAAADTLGAEPDEPEDETDTDTEKKQKRSRSWDL
jgi:TolA-binding protein